MMLNIPVSILCKRCLSLTCKGNGRLSVKWTRKFGAFSSSNLNRANINWIYQLQLRRGSDSSKEDRFNTENELLYGPELPKSAKFRRKQSAPSADADQRPLKDQKQFVLFAPVVDTNEEEFEDEQGVSELKLKEEDLPAILSASPSVINSYFPLLNPWRSSSDKIYLNIAESKLLEERKQVLTNHNVVMSKLPSVTKILGSTMSEKSVEALEKWKLKMIEKLGMDGFREYQKKIFERGRLLHQSIAYRLKGEEKPEVRDEIVHLWKSLNGVFPKIHDVSIIEKTVHHPFLSYKGVVDCVAVLDNELVVIDWKTSSRSKPSIVNLYDEPLQAVAYAGALNFDSNFDVHVDRVALVIAYENGTPAHIHRLSYGVCKRYWSAWLARLRTYYENSAEVNKV